MRIHKVSIVKMSLSLLAVAVLAFPLSARTARDNNPNAAGNSLAEQVRHQLVMLPYYGVFDNLEYEIQDNGKVVLSGQVTRPTLKNDAENVTGRLAGVGKVTNDIEVLPLSKVDDRIRIALYRTIFFNTQLDRYALQAVPPIHIIVKNGNVTLVGMVANQTDKDIAGILARGVPGIFKVTNSLEVEKHS